MGQIHSEKPPIDSVEGGSQLDNSNTLLRGFHGHLRKAGMGIFEPLPFLRICTSDPVIPNSLQMRGQAR